ncbi:hypothetical protein EHYA_09526 [Embleya hyalina]|uniref:Uncharacterized protein n=1 Tax=Embleya hyalina TaxID=516124 RepID=A0A401Z4G4_9ACTN|nr:hypothetical protein EHYA_09526 [Embleya hyalina]
MRGQSGSRGGLALACGASGGGASDETGVLVGENQPAAAHRARAVGSSPPRGLSEWVAALRGASGKGWGSKPDLGGWLWASSLGDLRFCTVGAERRASSAGFVRSDSLNTGAETETARWESASRAATPPGPSRRPKVPSQVQNRTPRHTKRHPFPLTCGFLSPQACGTSRRPISRTLTTHTPTTHRKHPTRSERPPADSTRAPAPSAAAGPFSPTNTPVSSEGPPLEAPHAGDGPPHAPDRPAPKLRHRKRNAHREHPTHSGRRPGKLDPTPPPSPLPRCRPLFAEHHTRPVGSAQSRSPARWQRLTPRPGPAPRRSSATKTQRPPGAPDPLGNARPADSTQPPPCPPLQAAFSPSNTPASSKAPSLGARTPAAAHPPTQTHPAPGHPPPATQGATPAGNIRPTRERTPGGLDPTAALPAAAGRFSPSNTPASSETLSLGAPHAGSGPPHDPDRARAEAPPPQTRRPPNTPDLPGTAPRRTRPGRPPRPPLQAGFRRPTSPPHRKPRRSEPHTPAAAHPRPDPDRTRTPGRGATVAESARSTREGPGRPPGGEARWACGSA